MASAEVQTAPNPGGPSREAGSALEGEQEERYDHRAKRTRAVPKHTLFGSVMERLDDDEVVSLRKIDIGAMEKQESRDRQARRDRYKPKLPASLKDKIPGDQILEYKKDEFIKQVSRASRARNLIDALEEKSKYFAVGAIDADPERNVEGRRHQWMTEKDLEHAGDINIVGLKGRSYNRERYQEKPPVHQYSVIGDPLKLGMDFQREPRYGGAVSGGATLPPHRYKGPDWLPREHYMAGKERQVQTKSAISLPPNIQHQFGTKICNTVLSDENKVKETLALQKRIQESVSRRRGEAGKGRRAGPVTKTDPFYEQLGGALRQNMFPGYTYNHKKSLARSVYTDDVHKRRYQDPEQWRYQRDALSTWNEYNAIYLKQKKKWDEYESNAPKFTANWDRTATRPPPPPKPAEPKPKPKPKPKKEVKPKEPAFEDVVFQTPPVTPPPPPPDPAPVDAGAKRDDEFWDFYNKHS